MTTKNKKRLKKLFFFLKGKIGLLSMCLLTTIIWGYVIRGGNILFCLAVGFGGYILIDLTVSSCQEIYSSDIISSAHTKKIDDNPQDAPQGKFTIDPEDIGEPDLDYAENFLKKVKKARPPTINNLGLTISDSDKAINDQIDREIQREFGNLNGR